MAILDVFNLLIKKYSQESAIIYTDSAYCINILTNWIYTWSQNNWKNNKKETIKNKELIISLYSYLQDNNLKFRITFEKVKGHNGNIGNELADALATGNTLKFSGLIFKHNINIHNFQLE